MKNKIIPLNNQIKLESVIDELSNVCLDCDADWIHIPYNSSALMNWILIFSNILMNYTFANNPNISEDMATEIGEGLHKLVKKYTLYNTKEHFINK